jgi:VHL beta domain
MSQNVMTAVWGTLPFFGFFVSLMIPRADQYYRAYILRATDEAHERARSWSQYVRLTPFIVLTVVALMWAVGAVEANWTWKWPGDADFWLLVIASVAQLSFAILVRVLVRPVPEKMASLICHPCEKKESFRSKRGETSVRIQFKNSSSYRLRLNWIDYDGNPKPYETMEAGQSVIRPTYLTHPFYVETMEGRCIGLFRADDAVPEPKRLFRKPLTEPSNLPRKALITDEMVEHAIPTTTASVPTAKSLSGGPEK